MPAGIEHELRTTSLPDERLNKRYRVLRERFRSTPTLRLPAACRGWAETQAAYRCFDNERIQHANLLQPHYDATLERMRAEPVVRIAQDTTEFAWRRPQEKLGGPLPDEQQWACTIMSPGPSRPSGSPAASCLLIRA